MISRSVAIAVLLAINLGWSQSTIQPRDRLREVITESSMVTLSGNVHPALAQAMSELSVDANFPMEHMILLLQPEASQQAALDQLVVQQHDPQSSQFHKFLTPEQYAGRFGVSQNDIDQITGWLTQQGFRVEEVTANHLSIVFSGDAYAVQSAFKTEVKQYSVNGKIHHANSSDPQIPAALSSVVKGLVKLHDFHTRSFSQDLRVIGNAAQPLYNASPTTHYVAPADWAMIYNVRPLYTGNLKGSGQSIAVVGRSNVKMSDIQSFRSQFGLPVNNPTVIVAQGSDPGFTGNGDAEEATLDVEWAGAVAPLAQVKFVISSSTATADGVDLAASYAVNHNVAPILSVSFGSCEAQMGSQLAFYNSLWQQAAAQGISVFVSSGDSGAAGCDSSGAPSGTQKGINGICSSPYATCVGGTEFKEGTNPSLYWLPGSNSVLGTAQGYIPEVVWNESGSNGGSDLAGGGGGPSIQWPKPSWQTGPGVPADGHRDVPDVALTAAGHDAYMVFYNGALSSVGGTSASTPSFASLFAIVNQKYNGTQGNINPALYPLAIKQAQGGAAVFHDITSGNNTVPGVSGYAAGVGYDMASGLGSVDAYQLVNHFHDVSFNGTFSLTAAPATVSLQAGQYISVTTSITVSNGFNWPVALSVSGLPTGVSAFLGQSTIPAPGSGTTALQFQSSSSAPSGTYTVTVTATGGGISQTVTVSITVTAIVPKCSLTATPATLTMVVGQATNVRLTCTAPQGGLPSSLALAVTGAPVGVTTTFSPATLIPGTAVSTLTIITSSASTAGSYTLAVKASGGVFSQTVNLVVTLAVNPSFAVTLASNSVLVPQAASATVATTVSDIGTFNNAITLAVSGLPGAMTGAFSPATLIAPGAGISTLTLSAGMTTPTGTFSFQVVVSGGGLVKSIPMTVIVTAAPSFTFTSNLAALAIQAGQTGGVVALTVKSLTGNFSSPVAFSVAGLTNVNGVTAAFSSPTLAAPGLGTSILTLSAPSSALPGQYKLTINAVGGTVTQSASLLLTILGVPGFTLKTDVTTLAITAGATFSTTVSIVATNSFNSPVALTIGTLPAGVTAAFSSTTISGANGTATLTIQSSAAIPVLTVGSYPISIAGTSPLIPVALPSQTAAMQLTIGSVQTSLSTAALTVARGASVSTVITDTATNFTGSASFSISGLPPGISYSFAPNSLAGSGSTALTLAAGPSTKPGSYTINVRTAAGGTTTQTALQLTID